VRYEEDRLIVKFDLSSLNFSSKNYKISYSIGLNDNTWHLDFYNKENVKLKTSVPVSIIKKFKALHNNVGSYNFYKHCQSCFTYTYSSGPFELDFKNCTVSSLTVNNEYFGIADEIKNAKQEKYKVYKIFNNFKDKSTTLMYSTSWYPTVVRYDSHMTMNDLILPLLKFNSKDEFLNRINKIMPFA
jgi:hypothetical protein